jgi:hypothetical protein
LIEETPDVDLQEEFDPTLISNSYKFYANPKNFLENLT